MMIFVVKNRKEIESGYFPGGYAILISITDPDKDHCAYDNRYGDVLQIKFDDADTQHTPDIQLISESDVKNIYKFVRDNKDAQFVVVNCEAGMSRSAGVAASLSKVLYGDDGYIITQKPFYNRKVYRSILEYGYCNNLII